MSAALNVDQLVGYQRAELNKASNRRTWLFIVQFLVAVPAAVSVFFNDGKILFHLAGAGALLLGVWILLDHSVRSHRQAGDSARRIVLVTDGLGQAISPHDQLSVLETFNVTEAEAAKAQKPNYFATKAPAGPKRLAEMLEESAFWTEKLQTDSARIMLLVLALFIVVFAGVWWFSTPDADASSRMSLARVFLAFLAFLLSSDVWGAIHSHFSARSAIKDIRHRLAAAAARGYPASDIILLMADYNAAVEAAPMSLPFLYRLREKRLNQLWGQYLKFRGTH